MPAIKINAANKFFTSLVKMALFCQYQPYIKSNCKKSLKQSSISDFNKLRS
jgi:hypothetical protein